MSAVIVILLTVTTFMIVVPWGGCLVRRLRAWHIGKNIRDDEPGSHEVKQGTPTMGGILFLLPLVAWLLVLLIGGNTSVWPVLLATIGFGCLGAYDDISGLRDETGVGWKARTKFPCQLMVGLLVAVGAYWSLGRGSVYIPGTSLRWELGFWYLPLATVVVAGWANAVNLSDGLDGLAGGMMVVALAAYGIITYSMGLAVEASICSVLGGALLAFLWYNGYPAQVFMGDVGSLALGAALAAIALMSEQWLLLPLVGIVFVVETLSVILQVAYFKYTRRKYGTGRRIFRMSPLHYHFELGGWSEVQVTQRFVSVAVMVALCGTALALGFPR